MLSRSFLAGILGGLIGIAGCHVPEKPDENPNPRYTPVNICKDKAWLDIGLIVDEDRDDVPDYVHKLITP